MASAPMQQGQPMPTQQGQPMPTQQGQPMPMQQGQPMPMQGQPMQMHQGQPMPMQQGQQMPMQQGQQMPMQQGQPMQMQAPMQPMPGQSAPQGHTMYQYAQPQGQTVTTVVVNQNGCAQGNHNFVSRVPVWTWIVCIFTCCCLPCCVREKVCTRCGRVI
ncbi:MAG: hypothetical protein MHM6MM_008087 [Cercozoa sp. M6MM]